MDTNEPQQALVLLSDEQPLKSKPWSPGLGKLLLQEADDAGGASDRTSGAVRLIAINPKLRAEAERLLPILEEMRQPARREEIVAVIVRAMPAWGIPIKTAGVMGVTFESYADGLEGYSLYDVEEAVVRWNAGLPDVDIKSAGFPPRPAQLAKLAQDAQREVYMARYRAKKALEYVEQAVPRLTEAEREERAAQLRDLLADLDGRKKANPLEDTRPRLSPQQVAEQLRAAAPTPAADPVGEVI
jgi:hypothetical protein